MLNIVCHYIPFHFSWNMLLRWTMFVDIFLAGSQGRREYQALWIRFQNVSRIMGNMICGWHYIYQILQNVKMPPNFTTKCRQWGCLEQMRKVKRHKKKQIQNDFPIIFLYSWWESFHIFFRGEILRRILWQTWWGLSPIQTNFPSGTISLLHPAAKSGLNWNKFCYQRQCRQMQV